MKHYFENSEELHARILKIYSCQRRYALFVGMPCFTPLPGKHPFSEKLASPYQYHRPTVHKLLYMIHKISCPVFISSRLK